MLLRIIDNHTNYVEQNKDKKTLLAMMTKIRAAQTLGATLCDRRMYQRSFTIYERLIKEALTEKMRPHFSCARLKTLEDALANVAKDAKEDGPKDPNGPRDRAWCLRSAIDTVYDECLMDYNEVADAMSPPNLNVLIKDTIKSAATSVASGNKPRANQQYVKLLEKMQNNKKYSDLVSPAAKKLVEESLAVAKMSDDDLDSKNSKLRDSLDRVYNEIRLPDVYSPSAGPLKPSKKSEKIKREKKKDEGIVMVEFKDTDTSLFTYDIQVLNDQVFGGKSEGHITIDQEKSHLHFTGSLSRVNRGGFASFRIIPTVREELKQILDNTTSIVLEIMNTDTKNNRFKFQLANEAHLKAFNWQSEFVVEPSTEFQTVVLDIYSFWPTMFGHVLSAPGNVDFTKVDCLGILISHVTVDGKENPDFVEGTFGLAVRSIRLIKSE